MSWRVLGLVGVFVVTACGGSGASNPSPSPTVKPIAFTMNAVGGSGVSGTGKITKGSGSFTVTVKLTGLAANSSHVSHIHKGSCSAQGGIALALQSVVADASGSGTATTTLPQDYLVPATGWYVNVHAGPDLSSPANGKGISCGDLSPG